MMVKQEQRFFAIKPLNIMDQLLTSNNLGRSVSKANCLRIRRAFAQGAKTLSGIMGMVRNMQKATGAFQSLSFSLEPGCKRRLHLMV